MIELQNISFSYAEEGRQVLKDVSLSIAPGCWVTLVGANGSGKSTLARHLNGLLLPNAGKVLVDGLDTCDSQSLPQIRQQVAFVFQNPDNQIVATTVADDVAFGPENIGLPPAEIEARVAQALEITGLTAMAEKAPHLLSGGEKQRLAIAGALAMGSPCLVLDEPTSMLDPQLRRQVLDTLLYLHQKMGKTIIYITNLMEEALLADRLLVLCNGQLVADGTPRDLFADPERFRSWNLEPPLLSRLAARLAANGYPQVFGALSLDEMVEKLCIS